MLEFAKHELYAKLCQEVDAHFIALRDSDREEERAYKDSVEKAHLYKRWDKNIIEKDKK